MSVTWSQTLSLVILSLGLSLYVSRRFRSRSPCRWKHVRREAERVVIIGASSGVGREIALQYASRNARVCVVARRAAALEQTRADCAKLQESITMEPHSSSSENLPTGPRAISVVADCSNANEAAKIESILVEAWGGIDTVIIAAGVSSVLPFAEISKTTPSHPKLVTGLERVFDVASRSLNGNFLGPMLSAAALIPLLESTSPSPSILLLSSVAAVIPAPTRALYASTKSASLLLFQSLSIEHPKISFSCVLPASIEGDFRASAVDVDYSQAPSSHSDAPQLKQKKSKVLPKSEVASRCISAVDNGERTVWMPWWYRIAHAVYWIRPELIERGARRKYGFKN